jgi:hypothetical protein
MSLFLINVRSKLALRLVFVLALILLTAQFNQRSASARNHECTDR